MRVVVVAMLMLASGCVAAQEVKVIDADDLALAPARYRGQQIEIRDLACFYAGPNAYRCTPRRSTNVLSIFSRDIAPADARERMERDCGTIRNVEQRKCRFTLRFQPEIIEQDRTTNFEPRTVIRPAVSTVVVEPQRRR